MLKSQSTVLVSFSPPQFLGGVGIEPHTWLSPTGFTDLRLAIRLSALLKSSDGGRFPKPDFSIVSKQIDTIAESPSIAPAGLIMSARPTRAHFVTAPSDSISHSLKLSDGGRYPRLPFACTELNRPRHNPHRRIHLNSSFFRHFQHLSQIIPVHPLHSKLRGYQSCPHTSHAVAVAGITL